MKPRRHIATAKSQYFVGWFAPQKGWGEPELHMR